MTRREVISRVKKSIREVSGDSRLPNKLVWSMVMSSSDLIIQRESDALRLANITGIYQVYSCVSMDEVPTFDDCNGLRSITTIYRSAQKIPDTYHDSEGPILRRIVSLDNSAKIYLVTPDMIRKARSDKNAKYDTNVYAYLKEGYLYMTRKVPLEIHGFFQEDVQDCSKHDDCTPYLDKTWWMPKKLQDLIISDVINKIAGTYKRIPEQQVIDKNQNT